MLPACTKPENGRREDMARCEDGSCCIKRSRFKYSRSTIALQAESGYYVIQQDPVICDLSVSQYLLTFSARRVPI